MRIPWIFLSTDLLEEVHFETPAGKRLFGVGWRSKGGYEVRNSIFKGFIGERKTISHIVEPGAERVYIFGGFINYLSMLQDKKVQSLSGSVITMNGDRLCDETFYEIQKHNYQEVILLADHDESGDSVKAYFTEELPKIDIRLVDGLSLYDGFNDYNDMIRGISLNGKSGR